MRCITRRPLKAVATQARSRLHRCRGNGPCGSTSCAISMPAESNPHCGVITWRDSSLVNHGGLLFGSGQGAAGETVISVARTVCQSL